MRFENWLSYRYLTASKGRFLSFLNFISIAGVAIGVMALIVVIGVMTGFGNNLREKIIGTTPHIMIEKETGIESFAQLENELKFIEGVQAASAYIQGNVFLESSGNALGLVIRGVNPTTENKITKIDQFLTHGQMSDLTESKIIIGRELARYFGYELGDTLTLISPGSGIVGQGWRYQYNIVGIFDSGMADYDMNLIIVNLQEAQKIFNLNVEASTGIGVKLNDPNQAQIVKERIYKELGYRYIVRSWVDINRNLFEALFLEKWGLFIILTLMVLVASFNIVSTLIVTVTSKVHDIGILKSIGVTSKSIRKIFIKQGLFIGFMGTLLGCVSGIGISLALKTYVKVPKDVYSIDHVPVDLQVFDIAVIIFAALLISYLATIYPSMKAAQLQPVEALRYE